MKGKILRDGRLILVRKGKDTVALCPLEKRGGDAFACNHFCALFSEPKVSSFFDPNKNAEITTTTLSLCHKTLKFDEFKDEREEK